MKQLMLIAIFACAAPALAGGSGGTTGGNPKPIIAKPFAQDPVRAAKLKTAVQLLRERLPQNCFPKDYNQAMLAEMDELVHRDGIFYFPETVLLGSERYSGDYGLNVLPNGDHQFFEVGAFTHKLRGSPIYFTKDSDGYAAEELAMTFAQDLNDHVLQWNQEDLLNKVGAMAMGREQCKPHEWGAQAVFDHFPEKEPLFEQRRSKLFDYLRSLKEKEGKILFGSVPMKMETDDITETRDGFTFVPRNYVYWTNDGYKTVPAEKPHLMEVVLNPFRYVKGYNLADSDQALSGIIRDPETRTVITEFEFGPGGGWGNTPFLMDPMCGSRQFNSNNAIRQQMTGGNFGERTACAVNVENGRMALRINRPLKELCNENKAFDHFNYVKTVDDFARETFCGGNRSEFTRENYVKYLGSKSPEAFVQDLIALNERKRKTPWLGKNILGGRLSMLGDRLAIVRDEAGGLYSVYVSIRGTYATAQEVADEDSDEDLAFQCFFKGPLAGTCNYRFYDDD